MRDMKQDEFRGWLHLCATVVCDFLFIICWLVLTWALEKGTSNFLHLSGLPLAMAKILEWVLYVSTLSHLIRLRFTTYRRRRVVPWWK
jgi:hypothetical protein